MTAVVFSGSDDSHIASRFRILEGWTRINLREEADAERKAFRRIEGNSATLDDLKLALSASLKAADQLADEAETAPCPFPEIPGRGGSVEEDWRNGLRAEPGLIRREVDRLQDLLKEALGQRLEISETEASTSEAPAP